MIIEKYLPSILKSIKLDYLEYENERFNCKADVLCKDCTIQIYGINRWCSNDADWTKEDFTIFKNKYPELFL